MTTPKPPDSLLADPRRGIYTVLVCRWGEAAPEPHPHAGRRLGRGDVRLPDRARLEQLPVTADHDGPEIGRILAAVSDDVALWASIKLGRSGQRLLARHRGVSLETDADGKLAALSLVIGEMPGLPSSKVFVDEPAKPLAEFAEGPDLPPIDPAPVFRRKAGTLTGSGAKAPVAPSEFKSLAGALAPP
jgi:hypothetical protein